MITIVIKSIRRGIYSCIILDGYMQFEKLFSIVACNCVFVLWDYRGGLCGIAQHKRDEGSFMQRSQTIYFTTIIF